MEVLGGWNTNVAKSIMSYNEGHFEIANPSGLECSVSVRFLFGFGSFWFGLGSFQFVFASSRFSFRSAPVRFGFGRVWFGSTSVRSGSVSVRFDTDHPHSDAI